MQNRFIPDIKDNQYIKKVAFLRTTRYIETVSLAIVNLKFKKKRKKQPAFAKINAKLQQASLENMRCFMAISNLSLIYRSLENMRCFMTYQTSI